MNLEKTPGNEAKQKAESTCGISLLETGRDAFPEIIRQIRSAGQEILVHMFIWREDRIGITIAEELLKAADRGVSVTIEKDRYGLLFEYSEESRRSFCHSPGPLEWIQITAMSLAGSGKRQSMHLQTERSGLYRKLKEHPKVTLKDNRKTKDHSKYYIFDRRTMILGGINIEDKEYYSDSIGRVYFDYMVRISDPALVSKFLDKRDHPQKRYDLFRANMKEPARSFEMKESFLELIDDAERELTIMMAYFAPDKEIMSAIYRALERGADVRILISGSSNFMNDTNMLTASKLLGSKYGRGGKLSVFTTDYMLHAKLVMSEKRIITGSCNLNQKAFRRLGELCVAVNNDDSPFACQVRASVDELFRRSLHIADRSSIRFSHLMAAAEMAVMR